jgi:hypothetical protein
VNGAEEGRVSKIDRGYSPFTVAPFFSLSLSFSYYLHSFSLSLYSACLSLTLRNRWDSIARISICAKFFPMQSRGGNWNGEKRGVAGFQQLNPRWSHISVSVNSRSFEEDRGSTKEDRGRRIEEGGSDKMRFNAN